MNDSDKTPVDGRDPITQLVDEMREMKVHCQKIADSGMLLSQEIPKIQAEIRRIWFFQAWFPTAAITVALIVKLLFLR